MPLITDDDYIKGVAREINPAAIERLLSYCKIRKITKKSIICRDDDACENVYYIIKGTVTVLLEDDEGHEVIMAYLTKGDFIGEIGLFFKTASCSAEVRAKTDCELAVIGHSALQRLFDTELANERADLMHAIGMQLSRRLLQTNRRVTRLTHMDVAGRIARTILDMCSEPEAMSHPEGTQIHISRKDIGRIAGCTRETVGRVLRQMANDGMIKVKGMDIVVFHSR